MKNFVTAFENLAKERPSAWQAKVNQFRGQVPAELFLFGQDMADVLSAGTEAFVEASNDVKEFSERGESGGTTDMGVTENAG